jgi:dienelactone hydrolase
MRASLSLVVALLLLSMVALADGPQDNVVTQVRRIPKLGIEVSAADRQPLEEGLQRLKATLDRLEQKNDARTKDVLPDVRVIWKAVHDALEYREIFDPREISRANDLLKEGQSRAELLLLDQSPWTEQTGLVVRGYVSRIDGSVQPYGLVIPASYDSQGTHRLRLDVWFHGRGENLSELNFLDERRRSQGQFAPPDTIVLHPYGRYCNAFRFAGEVDVLEAIDHVRKRYRIDDDLIAVRGFSMGGAACWQFAVHYADRWFAANPGAGFSETAKFLRVFQQESTKPTWYELKLWHLYDSADYAINLLQCPTVAYSGELDGQKQAADIMAEALKKEGIELEHVIGPQTKHAYEKQAAKEVDRRLASLAQKGRTRVPREVAFATYTLKYNQMNWVTIDALGEHWERATVQARLEGGSRVVVKTENVTALTLAMAPGWCPLDERQPVTLIVDGTEIAGPRPKSDRSWSASLTRNGGSWSVGSLPPEGLRKQHDLQGPIDDAFMDSFVFVRPTGTSPHGRVAGWVKQEGERAIEHWRRQYRGEARVKDDTAITEADIASSNLVLWGDPASNAVLKRIADRLPIDWGQNRIKVGDREYSADDHALILIYPNPLNPSRYVVLNSGFTFRDYDYLNNARQVPKLPDWAIVDVRTQPDTQHPGKIADADFFSETWTVQPKRER